jgi:hypothetical protein
MHPLRLKMPKTIVLPAAPLATHAAGAEVRFSDLDLAGSKG